eukprot:10600507-Alexandrium_andersonii.AAC.1
MTRAAPRAFQVRSCFPRRRGHSLLQRPPLHAPGAGICRVAKRPPQRSERWVRTSVSTEAKSAATKG